MMIDGRVVGYVGTIPTRFAAEGRTASAHWIKGFMVLPEHRNGPIGYFVLREAVARLQITAALTVAPASRRLFEALGFRNLGMLSNQIIPLRPSRVLHRVDVRSIGLHRLPAWLPVAARAAQRTGLAWLGGALAGLALRAQRRMRALASRGFTITHDFAAVPPGDIDRLWARFREEVPACAVRDSAYLAWRYASRADTPYRAVFVQDGDELAGVAFVRQPRSDGDARLRGIRVATLSDVMYPPSRPDAGQALLRGCVRLALDWDADAMLASATHPALVHALRAAGFIHFTRNVHALVRDPAEELPVSFDAWWLTRGDASSDETF